MTYNVKSSKAEEFISHEEILSTLEFANKNKNNAEMIKGIIEKAKKLKGLDHREASVLLACEMPELNQEVFALAEQIKKDIRFSGLVFQSHMGEHQKHLS